ncbi:MAG: rhamnulokinase [Lachnospiraceae bacterium]|nr:rhamnulokinase [Lachnospiraceae bacterium]
MSTYLAIDIGASSGRHLLGHFDGDHLQTEEIYRFQNGIKRTDDGLVWDIFHLVEEVINGIKKAGEKGACPDVIAIDTWGVDYVLLDKDHKELLPVYAYRDDRTIRPSLPDGRNAVEAVRDIISPEKLYARCGIQYQPFNTIFQLYCDKLSGKLERAAHFLMIPEYLAFRLTGEIKNEYTNATTTNLVHAESGTWDAELLNALGYPETIFSSLRMPSSKVGELLPEIQETVGFNSMVIFCPTHDTASAVCGSPIGPDDLYLSSGTWSLMGIESVKPMLGPEFQKANFTNEGGIEHRFRVLKNIMGMWLIQNIQANLEAGIGDPKYPVGCKVSFDEMVSLARASFFQGLINVNDERLVAPENMVQAIRECLGEPDISIGDVINCVYRSLAEEYRNTVLEIEKLTGRKYDNLYIVGGGCQNRYLNELTAAATGKKVFAGPVEATACGNLISQLMFNHPSIDLWKARRIIRDSFEIVEQ